MLTGIATWLLKGWLSRWAVTAEGEIKAGWRWLTASPVHFLIVALALSLGCNVWLWRGWDAEKAGRHSDAIAFQTASDQARTAQIAVNHQPAVTSQAIAEKSDAQAPAYYRRFAAAADTGRVPAPQAGLSAAGVPGADPVGTSVHGPAAGADTEVVCRPKSDDDFLTRSTARLALVLADVKALIAAGDAVPADEVPTETATEGPTP